VKQYPVTVPDNILWYAVRLPCPENAALRVVTGHTVSAMQRAWRVQKGQLLLSSCVLGFNSYNNIPNNTSHTAVLKKKRMTRNANEMIFPANRMATRRFADTIPLFSRRNVPMNRHSTMTVLPMHLIILIFMSFHFK
jgi:hypothetical protein